MSDEKPEKPKLALRVFKRTSNHLILLWRRIEGIDPLSAELTFCQASSGPKRPVPFRVDPRHIQIDEPVVEESKERSAIDAETVICLVKERDAGIDSSSVYYVEVKYGGHREGVRLTPAGVFPSHEREDRAKNVHLMGWDDEGQVWRKVSVVKGQNGRFYLGSLCPECSEGDE